EKLKRLGERQSFQEWTVLPKRGSILDRNGEPLAISLEAQSVYVRPRRLKEPERTAAQLAKVLGMRQKQLRRRLKTEKPFVWVKRQVTPREVQRVRTLRLAGVGMYYEPKRYYPHGRLAGQMIGFVGSDSQGLEGVEGYYDKFIRGKFGSSIVEQDALGRKVMVQGVERLKVPPGADIHLTLDASIQSLVEKQLEATVTRFRAKAGTAVLVKPFTGEVLAMANFPFFNPNSFTRFPSHRWRNRSVTDSFEPGSTFKVIGAAAALDEGIVGKEDLFYCELGRYFYGGRVIHDEKKHGWLTLDKIIKYSSNIGLTKVVDKLKKDRYFKYIQKFGFGQLTGIDLPGEAKGLVRSPSRWTRVDLAAHAFGQGIAVTPVQLVMAYAAIANGGFLMRPYVVRRVVDSEGKVLVEHEPHVVRRVISEKTARELTSILTGVVSDGGTGARAGMVGFQVAGKTGTAQKADLINGGYLPEKRIASFVGFVPAEDPRMVLLVLLDEPEVSVYGGVVAAPLFRAIARGTLRHLGIGPQWRATMPLPVVSRSKMVRVEDETAAVPRRKRAFGFPNFQGLSMREAVTRASALKLQVTVRGHGYVVGQSPAPGSGWRHGSTLTLTLKDG
ncbi:MAG: penicillin-binding protein, partial [Candidatus Binatia bacterium]